MRKTARGWNSTLRPGRPLSRKAALRATGGASRKALRYPVGRRPPTRLGIPRDRLEAWRQQERAAIRQRSQWCELLSDNGHAGLGTEVHHPFLRLDEPWASSQLTCLLLCHECHALAHRDARFRETLRVLSLTKLGAYLGQRIPEVEADWNTMIREVPPRAVFRWLIEKASAAGVPPPGWQEKDHE